MRQVRDLAASDQAQRDAKAGSPRQRPQLPPPPPQYHSGLPYASRPRPASAPLAFPGWKISAGGFSGRKLSRATPSFVWRPVLPPSQCPNLSPNTSFVRQPVPAPATTSSSHSPTCPPQQQQVPPEGEGVPSSSVEAAATHSGSSRPISGSSALQGGDLTASSRTGTSLSASGGGGGGEGSGTVSRPGTASGGEGRGGGSGRPLSRGGDSAGRFLQALMPPLMATSSQPRLLGTDSAMVAVAGGLVGSDGGGGCATEQSLPEPPSGVEPADRQSELHPGKTHEMPAIDEEGGALEQPQKQKLQQQDSTARFSPLRPLSALGSLQIRDSDGGDGQQFEGGGGGIDNASSSPRSGVAVSTRHHQPQHDWVLQGSSPAAVAGLHAVWSPGPAGRRGSSQAESVLGPWRTGSERRSSGAENMPVGR